MHKFYDFFFTVPEVQGLEIMYQLSEKHTSPSVHICVISVLYLCYNFNVISILVQP